MRGWKRVSVLVSLMLVLSSGCSVLTASQACAAEVLNRVDLRFLLVGASGQESTLAAWQAALRSQGVPFDVVLPAQDAPLRSEQLVRAPSHGRYQAVVQANDVGGPVALEAGERAALDEYLTTFGVREVIAYGAPPQAPPSRTLDLAGTALRMTPDGRPWFPHLTGEVPVNEGVGRPLPSSGNGITTLLTAADGRPVVTTTSEGGRERLYVAVQTAPWMTHAQLLAPGLVRWASRGVHLGLHRFYSAMQVDDVLLPNYLWDEQRNETVFDDDRTVRMTAADVEHAAAWSKRQSYVLDLAFNGGAPNADDVCRALHEHRRDFRWINHTYSHLDLDEASQQDIVEQIRDNLEWAKDNDIPLANRHELVTGEHTGLGNPAMTDALEATDIAYIAADASRQPEPYRLGPALAVPRHPVNIFYNVGTEQEQLDAYNHEYFEACDGDFCLEAPLTWQQYVDQIVRDLLTTTLQNDPRTTYVHQSNLAGDRNLLTLLDAFLAEYRRIVSAPLVQPTLTESAEALLRKQAWADAVADGKVVAYAEEDTVVLKATHAVDVPVTGAGDQTYAGERSGWISVPAGETVELPVS